MRTYVPMWNMVQKWQTEGHSDPYFSKLQGNFEVVGSRKNRQRSTEHTGVLFPLIDYTEVMGMYNEKSKTGKMKVIRGE